MALLESPDDAAEWEWDVPTGEVRYSAGVAALLGCSPAGLGGDRGWWLERIVPGDRARVARLFEESLATRSGRWTCEYEVLRDDGAPLPVLDRGFVVYADGRPLRALGVLSRAGAAVAPAPSLQARLELSERLLSSIVESIPQLTWAADATGWLDFYNQRWYEYTGTTPASMEGWGWVSVHDPLDLPRMLKVWRRALATGQPWEDEFRLRRGSDGALRWHLSRAMPMRDEAGRIVRWFGTNTDVHDQRLASEEYARLLAREQEARRAAESANRAKDEFLAVVSHELRTPLNAIAGWVQVLDRDGVDQAKLRKGLGRIDANVDLQVKLIEDLLDVSRIVSGKLVLERTQVDLRATVRSAVEALRPVAEEKGVLLRVSAGDAALEVQGDPTRLHQVVTNVLGNAIKFTPAQRGISVELRRDSSHAQLQVQDEGEGIAPDLIPRLFTRFSQADSSSTRRHAGLGLGLSIVRELVTLHEGTITATSDGPGRGATFTVRLPLLDRASASPLRGEPADRAEAVSLAGTRVLAVDDDRGAREVLAEVLLSCGATVTIASSVQDALKAFRVAAPDVVVTDLSMPELDGYSLLERVRQLPDAAAARVPVVVLTAFASLEERERALRAGFDRYLPKPIEAGSLSRAIAELVASRLR